jgi:hypothetical protein
MQAGTFKILPRLGMIVLEMVMAQAADDRGLPQESAK